MSARDGAASIQGDAIRITPLNLDGSIDTNKPVLVTNGFISASFGTEFEDGDEISEKAADGSICIQYKANDSMKGITFNLSLCSPDPEASALIAGGQIICATDDVLDDQDNIIVASGEPIGYTSPAVGATVGNPVAIEIWSKAIIKGKPAAGIPYFHWAFPYVRVRYEGDREFTNGALANEFTGTGVGNDALVTDGLNPLNPAVTGGTDDFVTYKGALINPFSYVRSQKLPEMGWKGQWTYTEENSLGCVPEVAPTDVTPGAPGAFVPAEAALPADLAALKADPVVGDTGTAMVGDVAWTTGQWVDLGDQSDAYWNGTAWVQGQAP